MAKALTTGDHMPPTRRDRLLKRATKGDKTVLPELRRLLDAEPWLWQQAGDLSVQAERSWISMVAGENLVASESAPRKMDALRRELAGPNPSVLERLLVDRVVLCWFQVNYCETLFAQWAKDLTIPQADYHQRRLDRAHGRYLLAIRTLACVRRLLVAPVQVNIGAQQVNVANANESGLPR